MSAERKIERSFIRSALERNTDGLNRIERPRAAGRPRTFNRPGANGRPLPITPVQRPDLVRVVPPMRQAIVSRRRSVLQVVCQGGGRAYTLEDSGNGNLRPVGAHALAPRAARRTTLEPCRADG